MSARSCPGTAPDGPRATRTIRVGGVTKADLRSELRRAGVRLNEFAEALFADERFTTSAVGSLVEIAELSVADLGLGDGATFAGIVGRAEAAGLSLCPLELGPHLRLQSADQPEGTGQATRHRAPPGSVTVASAPLAVDDDTPKGFYLRRIDGALWLRGYRSSPDHVWSPEDVLVFVRPRPGR